jgi:hypothetical protein
MNNIFGSFFNSNSIFNNNINSKNNICNICNKKINNKKIDYSVTVCNHNYHTSCLLNYMQKSYFCPTCRKELLENKFEAEELDIF